MPIENWLAFSAASIVLVLIPGPTVMLVLSYAISHGRKVAFATASGVALGDFISDYSVFGRSGRARADVGDIVHHPEMDWRGLSGFSWREAAHRSASICWSRRTKPRRRLKVRTYSRTLQSSRR